MLQKILSLSMAITLSAAEPIVIAHRGASGYLPEHTAEAKTLAIGMGADFVEQDLVLSADGVPVILHDIHLDTTTDVAQRYPSRARADGRYYALDFTLSELRSLRVSERKHPLTGKAVYPQRYPVSQGSFRISTFEEELELVAGLRKSLGRRIGIYPEIKQPHWHKQQGKDISSAVLQLLRAHNYDSEDSPCFLQCFELSEVQRLRTELEWKGQLIMLLGGSKKAPDGTDYPALMTPSGLASLAKIANGIGPSISSILSGKTPAERQVSPLVSQAHTAGLLVHPYTLRIDDLPKCISTPDELHELLFSELAVDGLFTDFPDRTHQWLSKHPR